MIDDTAPSRHGSVGYRRTRSGDRFVWLRHVHDALRQHEARAEPFARPGQHRVPGLRLLLDQAGGRFGAIEQQISAKIFCDLVCDRLRRFADRVDHRIGEPRERHARRIDHVGLRIPFRGDGLREGARGRRKCAP